MRAMTVRLVIFDGDNTLWDTNEVFANAQRRMLEGLRVAGFQADPDRDFRLLRELDDILIAHFRTHRYEPRYLAYALIRHARAGADALDEAALAGFDAESEELKRIAIELGERLKEDVQAIPRMFPGTTEALNAIRLKGSNVLVLYSDASPRRLDAISSHYNMPALFDLVVQGDKSDDGWARVLESGRREIFERFGEVECRVYVVGDLLTYDIRPANRLGAVTIYKPGGYRGTEIPRDSAERPAFTVQSLAEVIDIV